MWPLVPLVTIASAIAVQLVRRVAVRRALFDTLSERSLHKVPVPRLGGAAFMPVVLVAIGLPAARGELPWMIAAAFLGGAIMLYVVSLTDDLLTLSTSVRFAVHFTAAGSILWAAVHLAPLGTFDFVGAWFSTVSPPHRLTASLSHGLLILWLVGTVNIYNFMDGIDGIAGVQAVVAGVAWGVFGAMIDAPYIGWLGTVVAAGCLGFLSLNWPPAKIFMGDAGSTVLGYLFAALPLIATYETKGVMAVDRALSIAVLVLWPFLFDGVFTILRRLRKGENILKPHRTHLYQRLVISGRSHSQVTGVYGGLATVGALLAWSVVAKLSFAVLVAVVVVGALFLSLWRWVVWLEVAKVWKNAGQGEIGKTVRQ